MGFIYLILAVLSTALGQFFYKLYIVTKKKFLFLLTISMFIFIPIFSMMSLTYIAVDILYVFTSLTILFVVVLSRIFLKENISKDQFIGIVLIILGVIFYGY